MEARAPEPATTDNAAAWVTVDTSGTPVTVTPVVSVNIDDGTTTTVSAVPNDLTATVVTKTRYAEVTTSTGTTAPAPTATDKNGAGSFLACDNADGEYAPFCQPARNSSLYPGTTYYVTWDASVFSNTTNTTVKIEGSYVNATTGEVTSQAFSSPEIEAGWSYYAWTVESKLIPLGSRAVNITLALSALTTTTNNNDTNATVASSYMGPTVLVTKAPAYHNPAPQLPSGAALYVGLPAVLGFCVLMLFGVCVWNRQARRIGIGNIMSRGRHGYGAARERARRRLTIRRDRKQAIRLGDHQEGGGPEEEEEGARGLQHYRDEPESGRQCYLQKQEQQRVHYEEDGWGQDWGQQHEEGFHYRSNGDYGDRDSIHVGVARRDSDALGSLAGTPTTDHFPRA
ncbi:hypothetical protein SLS53_003052 [Cytospora paraplurivora]|uniref:Uncharacterized protein n=1 Tax=Cytospora paraplurivora TaxID=2898453 RepID=A0AAN9UD55_9PEZI